MKIQDFQQDILNELGNIGTGNAMTALENFLNKKTKIHVPYIKLLDYDIALNNQGSNDDVVFASIIHISGDIEGMILIIFEREFALKCLNILTSTSNETLLNLDALDISALEETANVITSAYLTALSKLTKANFVVSSPQSCIDMFGAVLAVPAMAFGCVSDSLLFIQNDFSFETSTDINSSILLFAKEELLRDIINRLANKA